MYDDQWVYSKPGQFRGGAPSSQSKKAPATKDADMPPNPNAAV
jgi:hypothetical protein